MRTKGTSNGSFRFGGCGALRFLRPYVLAVLVTDVQLLMDKFDFLTASWLNRLKT